MSETMGGAIKDDTSDRQQAIEASRRIDTPADRVWRDRDLAAMKAERVAASARRAQRKNQPQVKPQE